MVLEHTDRGVEVVSQGREGSQKECVIKPVTTVATSVQSRTPVRDRLEHFSELSSQEIRNLGSL